MWNRGGRESARRAQRAWEAIQQSLRICRVRSSYLCSESTTSGVKEEEQHRRSESAHLQGRLTDSYTCEAQELQESVGSQNAALRRAHPQHEKRKRESSSRDAELQRRPRNARRKRHAWNVGRTRNARRSQMISSSLKKSLFSILK